MSTGTYCRRGGMLRGMAWIAVAAGAFVLVTALVAFRGGKIQQELQETGQKIQDKYPELKEKLAELPDFPDLPNTTRHAVKPQASGREQTSPDGQSGPDNKLGQKTPGDTVPKPADARPKAEPAYSVEDPPPVAKAQHKVTKGETLYSLAETYYEDGSLWKLIAKANDLKDPADLREGMVVTIPGK